MDSQPHLVFSPHLLAFVSLLVFVEASRGADALPSSAPSEAHESVAESPFPSKPIWISDLSASFKESYDDNIYRVSGYGLTPQSSSVETISVKLGFNLAPFIAADPSTLQTFVVVYQPDHVIYNQASSENYTANRLSTKLLGRSNDVTFSFDNAFLYNDGNKLAPTYALNQLSGSAGNQNDKYRNSLAHAPERERRNQDQDRYTAYLQYDYGSLFLRPISSLNLIHMNTALFNTSTAPYKGYQDYVDRSDINAGADLGLKIDPHWAVTLGYRYGFQYQSQFATTINSDQHFSSNHYQRVLLGFEGKVSWLSLKLAAGPDIRDFNPSTPISDLHTTRFYGEAALTAYLTSQQSLTFSYRDYVFVSSTGLVPYEDYSYTLTYHWSVNKTLGIDLGAKFLEHNYTIGNDVAGSAPSLRDDFDFGGTAGITYSLAKNIAATVSYNRDDGQNGLGSLPAKFAPSYRYFREGVFAAGIQYSF